MEQVKLLLVSFLTFSLLFVSCREKEIKGFDVFEGEKLQIESQMGAGENASLTLKKTVAPFSVIQPTDNRTVSDALVTVYEDGSPIALLASMGDGNYQSQASFQFKQGKAYHYTVLSPNQPMLETVPEFIPYQVPVFLDSISMSTDSNYYNIYCHFTDSLPIDNKYSIACSLLSNQGWNTYSIKNQLLLESSCLIYSSGFDFTLLNDRCIQGQKFKMLFTVPARTVEGYQNSTPIYNYTNAIRLELKQISNAFAEYEQTKMLQIWASADPFSNVVTVFSNVKNGYGIVAAYAADTVQITLR